MRAANEWRAGARGWERRVTAPSDERICLGEMTVAQAAMVLEGNWEDEVAR